MSKGHGWMVTGWLMMISGQDIESASVMIGGLIVVFVACAMIFLEGL